MVRPGYKRTEVGEIPEDWRATPLREIVDRSHPIAYGVLKPGVYVHGGIPLLQIGDVIHGAINIDRIHRISEQLDRQYMRTRLIGGEIVVSLVGTIGKVALIPPTLAGGNLHRNLGMVRVSGDHDSKFIACFLTSGVAQGAIRLSTFGSTQALLNLADLRGLMVIAPPLVEQRSIAAAMYDADALIESLEHLLAKKRAIKQGAMQSLLTGAKRLPDFTGAWETTPLGTICNIVVGRTPPRSDSRCWGAGSPWLTIADLRSKRVTQSKEQITSHAKAAMRMVKQGTLMMSFKLSIGRLCFAGCDLFTNEAICSFEQLQANADYLYYALTRVDFSLYGKQAVKGYTLNQESLRSIAVPLPTSSEQAAIAEVLAALEADLDATTAKLDKARALKQGMMQELLTGRIRLV